jgi:hypothetical protein
MKCSKKNFQEIENVSQASDWMVIRLSRLVHLFLDISTCKALMLCDWCFNATIVAVICIDGGNRSTSLENNTDLSHENDQLSKEYG